MHMRGSHRSSLPNSCGRAFFGRQDSPYHVIRLREDTMGEAVALGSPLIEMSIEHTFILFFANLCMILGADLIEF